MDRAKYEVTGDEYLATDLRKMDPVTREHIRERLVCIGCGSSAYWVPPTKRGTCYFGARHVPGCDEGVGTAATDTAALPETEVRALASDVFRLRPHRPQAGQAHVIDDPDAAPHHGRARRYVREPNGPSTATPSVGLRSLLSKLGNDPVFAKSTTRIDLPDGHDQVRRCCVNVADITEEHKNRKKVYWGTLHYAKAGNDGAAWLYTQQGAPNILLPAEMLEVVMRDNRIDDLDEFSGASFIYYGYLNKARDKDWTYFKPKDPEWFALRMPR